MNDPSRSAAPSTGAALAGLLAAGAGLAVYSLAVEPYRLEVTRVDIYCPRLPSSFDGLSVLLLADTHISRWGRRERALARLLDALPTPDVAVLAGDLIQGGSGMPLACRLAADHVRARHARYAILGNAEHKQRGPRRRDFVARLRSVGITVLVNGATSLAVGGDTITVAGVDDPYYGHADLQTTLRDWDRARFCLLLAHSPQIAPLAVRAGVDLILSGHTHGGQVRLPLIGALETHNPLGRRMDRGLFDRARLHRVLERDPGGDSLLYVSRGIGVANFGDWPVYPRLFCRPEIAWLTLRRGEAL